MCDLGSCSLAVRFRSLGVWVIMGVGGKDGNRGLCAVVRLGPWERRDRGAGWEYISYEAGGKIILSGRLMDGESRSRL